ncbi:hypothetical protein M3Y94_01016400 [Aphelenchoides besseyi]|nr:hypothetical protein M3Y94_01016400 [Aphelenchoides besseyi]KAI6220544.1 hypothetical protein M3Y95_01051600 [Aphelenchoides besseyi]
MAEENVLRWQVDNFGQRLANDIENDEWLSPLVWFKPSPYCNVPAFLKFHVPSASGAAAISLELIEDDDSPMIRLNGDIWMENTEGTQSPVKKINLCVYSDDPYTRESNIFERADLDKFKDEKTMVICIKTSIRFSFSTALPTQWMEQRWEVQYYDYRIEMGSQPVWSSQPFALSQLFDGKFQFTFLNLELSSLKLMDSSESGVINVEYQIWHESDDERSYKQMGHLFFGANRQEHELYFYAGISSGSEDSLYVCFNARLWMENKETSTDRIDVSRLYEKADFADLELRVGEVKFKASKSILCSQSEVFYRMFTHQTKEKATGIVNIKNFDAQVVEKMLVFFYFGKVDDMNSWAHRLLKIADYYEIQGLIDMCVQSITRDLTMDNFFETFLLAVQLGHLNQLKIYLLEYAKYHRQQITNHPQIKDFISRNLDATYELLQLFTS